MAFAKEAHDLRGMDGLDVVLEERDFTTVGDNPTW